MEIDTIYTVDARDNVLLEVMKSYFGLDENQIYNEINNSLKYLITILKKKGINYKDLKSALVPSEKKEIAFVFDTTKIRSSWYGLSVMTSIIPLLEKNSTHSVLVGDYLGSNEIAKILYYEFVENINTIKEIDYSHHSQFYIVYINNLTEKMVENLNNGLLDFTPYVGYFDLTYSSFIKTYMSTILVRLFIKNKKTIIQAHEDDIDENINISGYPFEKYGYSCKSIQSIYYGLFLSYKIERKVFDGFQSDTTFSLNSITKNVFDITDFKLQVEESKLAYLINEKKVNLERAGIANLSTKELEKFIKEKINSNYLYNLCYNKAHKTLKFNLIIETQRSDNKKPFKLTVALEYKPFDKTLRLITMF